MSDDVYDYAALLREPKPHGLPLALIQHWENRLDLRPAESRLYLVDGYIREVCHGGHQHWFSSSYADEAVETAEALEQVGLPACAAHCRRALEVWPDAQPPHDQTERQEVVLDVWFEDDPEGVMDRLHAIDESFYELRYEYGDVVYRHLLEHAGSLGVPPEDTPTLAELRARLAEQNDD